jgi:UDP-3-O-[3-hydroxymyristoyl] glucosamine N-acyltransferase
MSDSSLSLKNIAEKLGLEFSGNAKLKITHVCGLDSLQKGGLAYLASPDGLANVPVPKGMSKHADISMYEINSSEVALIVSPGVKHDDHNLIFSEDPLATHVEATKLLHSLSPAIPGLNVRKGVHSSAVVNKGVKLGKNVKVGPKSVIYEGVKIGDKHYLACRSGNNV